MQLVRKAAFRMEMRMASLPTYKADACVPVFGLQGKGGRMGHDNDGQHVTVKGIEPASPDDRCEVCGRVHDVVQFICTVEGPDPDMGGLANVVYICTYCCARAIQAATGFKAVKVLRGWYQVRAAFPNKNPRYIDKVNPEDIGIG